MGVCAWSPVHSEVRGIGAQITEITDMITEAKFQSFFKILSGVFPLSFLPGPSLHPFWHIHIQSSSLSVQKRVGLLCLLTKHSISISVLYRHIYALILWDISAHKFISPNILIFIFYFPFHVLMIASMKESHFPANFFMKYIIKFRRWNLFILFIHMNIHFKDY